MQFSSDQSRDLPGRHSLALTMVYLTIAILIVGIFFFFNLFVEHSRSVSTQRLSDLAKQRVLFVEQEIHRREKTAQTLASLYLQNYLQLSEDRAQNQLLDYIRLNMVEDQAEIIRVSIHSAQGYLTTLSFDEKENFVLESESSPFKVAIFQLGARWEVGPELSHYIQPLKLGSKPLGYLDFTFSTAELVSGFGKKSDPVAKTRNWWLGPNGQPGNDSQIIPNEENKKLKLSLQRMAESLQSGIFETACPWHGGHRSYTAFEPLMIGDYDLGIMTSMEKDALMGSQLRLSVILGLMFAALMAMALLILKINSTKRKTVQLKLADEKAVNEGIFRSIDDLIFQQDLTGVYTDCNRSFADFFGLSPQEIQGRTDSQIGIQDDQTPVSEEDRALLRRAQSQASELWINGPKGLPELLDLRKHPLKHLDGRVYGIIGIGRIKTEQWHSEQKLIELKEKLEAANSNMEEALNRAKKFSTEADAANKAKSEFLANMSHEIRTPLGALIGLTDLLAQTNCSPKQLEYLSKLDNAAHSLLHIINDILDFSKIEAGKMTFEVIPFHLGEIISQVTEMFSERVMSRNLYFINKREDVPDFLIGDPIRLRQILVNILGNALKFTKTGGITLTVDNGQKMGDKTYLVFSIQDTGIGIPADKLDSLFNSFSQADSSTTRQFGGSGLGLSICQQLTELMGGNIWVESEVGAGTTFHFTLPFEEMGEAQADTYMEEMFQRQSRGLVKPGMPLEGLDILLVDDNEINREVISEILTQRGATVATAENGQIGVDLVEAEQYHLILMDMQMPIMDGPTAARQIRKSFTPTQLPILALTANALAEDKKVCLESGMNDFMAKPLDPAQLVDTILALVNTSNTKRSPANPATSPKQTAIPEIPGINLAEALNRIGNNKQLLVKLIRMFTQQHGKDVELIQQALAREDRKEAIHLSHALKGTAGNLSLPTIQKAASDLETSLRANDSMPGKIPDALVEAMTEGLNTLQVILAKAEENPGQGQEDREAFTDDQARQWLSDLKNLVEKCDVRADDLFSENRDRLKSHVRDETLETLSQALMVFDFNEAERAIDQGINELEKTKV